MNPNTDGACWHIRGGRLLDPATGRDEIGDLWLCDGRIAAGPPTDCAVNTVDATGCIVAPALWDLHVHFRDPGDPAAEDTASGSAAAAAGGFGTVVIMPNTKPPLDTPEAVRAARDKAAVCGLVRIEPTACLTSGRQGRAPADITALAAAGVRVFTDDGGTVADEVVLREIMRRVGAVGGVLMDHALDPALAGKGVIREGATARRLGLPELPPEAEWRAIERDIAACRATGTPTHIQHVFTAGGVGLIRDARAEGLPVTGEVTPHHLALCDADIPGDDANYKMNPPLGDDGDRALLREAVLDGSLSVLATDHAPHTAAAKSGGFKTGPFGVIGLETAVGVTHTILVRGLGMPLMDWLRRWTTGPAAVLGRPAPGLGAGAPADVVVLDLDTPYPVDPARFLSRSRNTPFGGMTLWGRARHTWCAGRPTFGL